MPKTKEKIGLTPHPAIQLEGAWSDEVQGLAWVEPRGCLGRGKPLFVREFDLTAQTVPPGSQLCTVVEGSHVIMWQQCGKDETPETYITHPAETYLDGQVTRVNERIGVRTVELYVRER